ncbi:hypothetical protein OXT66_05750 [Lentilactobacillus senioris]|uniref:hypothetical protein n=1 Tax=Lentilactobacillus senioris TaxID=931534 RepID=UPI00227F8AF7|nr:hypothetical protein [Lentilactobacillus senioris]MCY9807053.1 hypothetical protein [Lentilactobacillus senioris]
MTASFLMMLAAIIITNISLALQSKRIKELEEKTFALETITIATQRISRITNEDVVAEISKMINEVEE